MQLARLHPQEVEYFRQTLGEFAFQQALTLAHQYREPIVKVLKAAVRNLPERPRLKSRFDRLTSGFGEEGEPSTIPRGNKRDIEGNIKPQKLDFGEVVAMSDNINFSRSSVTIGSTKKRTAKQLFKAQLGAMKEVIYRWQNCSNSLLGPGALPISFGRNHPGPASDNQGAQNYLLPFHIMSLTTHPEFANDTALGCHDKGMARVVYRAPPSAFAGDIGYNWLSCETQAGTVSLENWKLEKGTTPALTDDVFHKWTEVRLNLYGAVNYPLTYRVQVLTGMPREMQLFEHSIVSATVNSAPLASDFPLKNLSPLNEMIIDRVRPMLTNPIKGSNSNDTYVGKYKVLMDKKYSVPCLAYGDANAIGTSSVKSTNVKNVNIFLRHDRYRNYSWHARATDEIKNYELNSNAWTATDISSTALTSLLSDVDREERVFLVITCNAPSLVASASKYDITTTPDVAQEAALSIEGSYDIVVRNCFRDGSSAEGA